jgi:hypothetical protein
MAKTNRKQDDASAEYVRAMCDVVAKLGAIADAMRGADDAARAYRAIAPIDNNPTAAILDTHRETLRAVLGAAGDALLSAVPFLASHKTHRSEA